MLLEEVYENQLYKKPQDELLEKHKNVLSNVHTTLISILKCKLHYKDGSSDFSKFELQSLERFEAELVEFQTRYHQQFIEHPVLNHPPPAQRPE